MSVALVHLPEIVHVDHVQRSRASTALLFQQLLCPQLSGGLIVKSGESVPLRPVLQKLGPPFFLPDVRDHADHPQGMSHLVHLGRNPHPAPAVAAFVVRHPQFLFIIRLSPGHVPQQGRALCQVIRMDVGADGNLFHQTVPDGLVAKFPFPVVRGRKPVLRYIPLHDNVIGLLQNQLVTLLHPPQLLLGALGSGHIHKHMKQGGIPLFVHREMCPVQKPDRVPVLSPGAVFHFHHISHPQLFPNLPQHLLPVPGVDQIPVMAVKLFPYLLLAVTQKPAETVVHLPDRHMRVAQAQEGASQQIAPGPGCRLRFGLIPAFLSFSLYFPDEQNLFVVQGTGVHPQHGAAAPQNALRPPLPYPKMNLAAHLFPLQETAHRLRHKRNKRRPVLGKHGLLRKEADRILKPPAGPQRIKNRGGQIFQMIEAGL